MKTIIGVIFLVFVIIIGMSAIDQQKTLFYESVGVNESTNNSTLSFDNEDVILSVTITGQVKKEGTYEIEYGGFLQEVIELAGGLTSSADKSCFDYNLAIIEDIEIYIPAISLNNKTSINNASLEEITKLEGIGKVLGANIIDYREANGKFLYLEQLMKVSGIGKVKFNNIRDLICL